MIRTLKHWVEAFLPYRPTIISPAEWDRQFAQGRWAYLSELTEFAHQSVIAGYIARRRGTAGVSVLDVGCGEGYLRDLLPPDATYVGIDLSAAAIEKARSRDKAGRFEVADAETYTPDRRYQVVVFNECLYYLRSPQAALQHYAQCLEPNGCMVISMYVEAQTRKIWQMVHANTELLDQVRVTNARGTAWDIALVAARGKG